MLLAALSLKVEFLLPGNGTFLSLMAEILLTGNGTLYLFNGRDPIDRQQEMY